jgi:hypothetical protein
MKNIIPIFLLTLILPVLVKAELGNSPETIDRLYGPCTNVIETRDYQTTNMDITVTFQNGVVVAIMYVKVKSRQGNTSIGEPMSEVEVAKYLSRDDPNHVGWNKKVLSHHDTRWFRKDGKAVALQSEGSILCVCNAVYSEVHLGFGPKDEGASNKSAEETIKGLLKSNK